MRRLLAVAATLLCALGLSSCAAISVNNIPQPGDTYSDGYDIVIEFANVLNLTDRAKIMKDGIAVGVVEQVHVGKSAVEVSARIDRSVAVPSDVHAVLQQATVLGDIYVALNGPPDTSGTAQALPPGGRIPLAQTTSPPQLEDTLATMANFMASGSIQRFQDTIIGINRVAPERTEQIRAIAARTSADLSDLANNIDTVDAALNGISQSTTVLAGNAPRFQYWFSPEGMLTWERVFGMASTVGTTIASVGSVYNNGHWAVPLIDSMGNALGEIRNTKQGIENEYRPWRQLFTNMFLPQDKYPAMNIVSVQTSDGREISQNVQDVLRMIGAVP